MPTTENVSRRAICPNVPDCAKAVGGETLKWYRGAGEYCPECGEALTSVELALTQPAPLPRRPDPPGSERTPQAPPKTTADSLLGAAANGRRAPAAARKSWMSPLRWFWLVAAALVAGSAIVYAERRAQATDRTANDAVTICPVPSAQQLAGDIVRGYAAKSGVPANRFIVTNAGACDVLFSTAAESPDAVIARDGIVAIVNPVNAIPRISESQLRAIFSGAVRDWSQIGGPHGRIVPILTDSASDEAKVLALSLFYGVGIDRSVRRAGTSADVTRAVTGADRASQDSIGMVAFSQAVPARVVPLEYLPPPSELSIATHRYPYALSIAVESASAPPKAAAEGLINYARSSDGAAIVAKAGLIGREGQ